MAVRTSRSWIDSSLRLDSVRLCARKEKSEAFATDYTLHKFALRAKRTCERYKYVNKGYINVAKYVLKGYENFTSTFSKDM